MITEAELKRNMQQVSAELIFYMQQAEIKRQELCALADIRTRIVAERRRIGKKQ